MLGAELTRHVLTADAGSCLAAFEHKAGEVIHLARMVRDAGAGVSVGSLLRLAAEFDSLATMADVIYDSLSDTVRGR